MTVRAKFKVTRTSQSKHWQEGKGPIHEITLQPVVGGSPENDKFYEATPCGEIKLGTINDAAAKFFPLGGEVYVDFTLVEG